MTKSYLIHAWCIRPFIAYLDPVEAGTPEEAIAIARRQPEKLIDNAEECSSKYPWDEFAVFGDDGTQLLRALEPAARLRDSAPAMRDTLLYVAGELGAFKPDYLRQIGLDVALEQIESVLAIMENTSAPPASAVAANDQD